MRRRSKCRKPREHTVRAVQGRRAGTDRDHRQVRVFDAGTSVAESGLPGFKSGYWYGLLVAVRTPKKTITAIHSAAISALKSPTVSKRLSDLGYIPVGDQPEEFAAYLKSEIEKLGKIVKALNLSVD